MSWYTETQNGDDSTVQRNLNFLTGNLPTQTNCSAFRDIWPKSGICSNNAIACEIPDLTYNDPDTFSCVCADGWTGKGDFNSLGSTDCHLKENVINGILVGWGVAGALTVVVITLWCYHQFLRYTRLSEAGRNLNTSILRI